MDALLGEQRVQPLKSKPPVLCPVPLGRFPRQRRPPCLPVAKSLGLAEDSRKHCRTRPYEQETDKIKEAQSTPPKSPRYRAYISSPS